MTHDFPLFSADAIVLLQERPENIHGLFAFTVPVQGGEKGYLCGALTPLTEYGPTSWGLWTRGLFSVPHLQERILSLTLPVHRSDDILDDTASDRLLRRGVSWENLFLAAKSCERWSDIMYDSMMRTITAMDGLIYATSTDKEEHQVLDHLLNLSEDSLISVHSQIVTYIDSRSEMTDSSFTAKRESAKRHIITAAEESRTILLHTH